MYMLLPLLLLSDFPTVNAAQPNYGGGQSDGVVFKMNPTLSYDVI